MQKVAATRAKKRLASLSLDSRAGYCGCVYIEKEDASSSSIIVMRESGIEQGQLYTRPLSFYLPQHEYKTCGCFAGDISQRMIVGIINIER